VFIGHFAVGFAAKAAVPRVNLGWLVTAGVLVDLVLAVLLLLGVEHLRIVPGFTAANPMDLYYFPWSHSLALILVWSLAAAGAWWLWQRDSGAALAIGAVVMSHWVLDVVSHVPDMPLWPGSAQRLGLGLWRSVAATVVVEGLLWAAAVAIYLKATRARDRVGIWSFWAYVVLLSGLYVANLVGPPPEDMRVVVWANLSIVIFLLWPAWFDRHRDVRHAG
jgi:hypothetical protein